MLYRAFSDTGVANTAFVFNRENQLAVICMLMCRQGLCGLYEEFLFLSLFGFERIFHKVLKVRDFYAQL